MQELIHLQHKLTLIPKFRKDISCAERIQEFCRIPYSIQFIYSTRESFFEYSKGYGQAQQIALLKVFCKQHMPLTNLFAWIKEKLYYQNKHNLQ